MKSDARQDAIAEIERLVELANQLQTSLQANEAVYLEALEKFRRGDPIRQTLEDVNAKAAHRAAKRRS